MIKKLEGCILTQLSVAKVIRQATAHTTNRKVTAPEMSKKQLKEHEKVYAALEKKQASKTSNRM